MTVVIPDLVSDRGERRASGIQASEVAMPKPVTIRLRLDGTRATPDPRCVNAIGERGEGRLPQSLRQSPAVMIGEIGNQSDLLPVLTGRSAWQGDEGRRKRSSK
jgi:hypothetical protein